MVTRRYFARFVLALAFQRLAEVWVSRRNENYLRRMGGREHYPVQLRLMKLLHAGWLAGMLAEVFLLRRRFVPALALPAGLVFLIGQILCYTAILTLRRRWTVTVMTVPGASLVTRGIYRYLRHPNYLGVALEVAAAPLLHSAYLTAAFFSALNTLLLAWRIRAEERVLSEFNDYRQQFLQSRR